MIAKHEKMIAAGGQTESPDPLPARALLRSLFLRRAATSVGTNSPKRCRAVQPGAHQTLAAKYKMVIVVPVYEREMSGLFFNTAAVIDATENTWEIPKTPYSALPSGILEKFYFTPGNTRLSSV